MTAATTVWRGPKLDPRDVHIVVNTKSDLAKCFDHEGQLRWAVPCHNEGVAGPGWSQQYGDTPPGLWKVVRAENIPFTDADRDAFGPVYFYLEPVAGPATEVERAGIGWHGGGSGLPSPYRAAYQGWVKTHGCLRSQNQDLLIKVLPTVKFTLARGGVVWLSVKYE